MNDLMVNVAQELADHLDDLRHTEHGVTDYDGDERSFPINEVGDADLDKGLDTVFAPSASFIAIVNGQRLRVRVSAEQEERKVKPAPGTFGPWGPKGRSGL